MICVNSASDWGESSPSMLVDTALEFRRRGHTEEELQHIFYSNPCRFFGTMPKVETQTGVCSSILIRGAASETSPYATWEGTDILKLGSDDRRRSRLPY